QLTENDITNLFAGKLPTDLPSSEGLMAWWDFEVPPDGLFISITPPPNTTAGKPNLFEVVHLDGTRPLVQADVGLKVDNVAVPFTFSKVGDQVTVSYPVSPLFKGLSQHTASFSYVDATGAPKTLDWSFTIAGYPDASIAVTGVDKSKPGFM